LLCVFQAKNFLPPALSEIENRGNKTQNKDFYLQHSHKFLPPALSQIENGGNQNTKQRFLPPGGKNLCFVFLLPLFSICESVGGKNLCLVFWLPPFSIYESAEM
jgi:hypothetical protein